MNTVDSHYALFGLRPNCGDDELRDTYLRLMKAHHPDLNPHRVEEANTHTQRLNLAYQDLKRHRATLQDGSVKAKAEQSVVNFSVVIDYPWKLDLSAIAHRTEALRQAWEKLEAQPTDPVVGLYFIHAAVQADREDYHSNLLENPILIDSAALLLSCVDTEAGSKTLIRWAEILYCNGQPLKAIQILEDAYAFGSTPDLKECLRRYHYGLSKSDGRQSKQQPSLDVCIHHLKRILDLGYDYDYIYKRLAEAYHDFGDDVVARQYLARAYSINPELTGAIKISRALGFPVRTTASPQRATAPARHLYSRPDQIPSLSQIQVWADNHCWELIFSYSNMRDYSPRIISQGRNVFGRIARVLRGCSDQRAIEALTALFDCVYWDVREQSMLSLCRIGDDRTLDRMRGMTPRNSREQYTLKNTSDYLEVRLATQQTFLPVISDSNLIAQADNLFASHDYGKARFLYETAATMLGSSHPQWPNVSISLAQTAAKMYDYPDAINLIRMLPDNYPDRNHWLKSREMREWVDSLLVFEQLDHANADNYILRLRLHVDHALDATDPDELLRHLRELSRGFGVLGKIELAEWLRTLIRDAAPGTFYVDKYPLPAPRNDVALPSPLEAEFEVLATRLKHGAPLRLNHVMGSVNRLNSSVSF